MLNLSPLNKVLVGPGDEFSTLTKVEEPILDGAFARFLKIMTVIVVAAMFLPWTQNVRAKGYITTLRPDNRPQSLESVIPGKVEKWYVREGDFVEKGDTLLFLSEVKDEYFDPKLLERTSDQIVAKAQSADSYSGKVRALSDQIALLEQASRLKLEQARLKQRQSELKVASDSADLVAVIVDQKVADDQYQRTVTLYDKGLKSLSDLEGKRMKNQETLAKRISQENKLAASRNDLQTATIELQTIANDYREKITKAKSEQFSALSAQYDTEATVSKLENQRSNYQARQGLYFVTAPQAGFVTKTITRGIGELIKEGEAIATIMPKSTDLAVEMYVKPLDLPLMHIGSKIRVQFDGWPAIIFSGWPNVSYGTYGAEIAAIDQFASPNGMFRILLRPDAADVPWPDALRVGSGANSIALLEDVPVGYELWRQINGFPPNYYQPENTKTK